MSGPDIEARIRAVQEQQRFVQQLRDGGHAKEAEKLQDTYHAREMSALSTDVYLSARHEGKPPAGWTRASLDPEALRAAGIDLSDDEVRNRLQPPDSGFRAEIYIPDKRVFGEDVKPVVVFKGSTGAIIDPAAPGGRRESGGEDFLNNGQQAVGLRSDYYDRAMQLATIVNGRSKGNFEITGHSLGGGMASAASAVTGVRATTFNSAGLHPQTAERFSKENGLPTFNTQDTVHTYQTSGEVLNDVQNGLQRLNERQRREFGLLANETSLLLREPMMQNLVKDKLQAALPPGAQTAAAQLVERLATESGAEALRNVPVAAGKMEILLDAKMRDGQGTLVDRGRRQAPSQVAEFAGPLASVLVAGAHGMRAGRLNGELIEQGGAVAGKGMDRAGDLIERGARMQGQAIGTVVDYGGLSMRVGVQSGATVIAQGRELVGMVDAIKHRVEGQGSRTLSNWGASVAGWVGADETAERLRQRGESAQVQHAGEAAEATRQASVGAARIRADGERVGGQLQQGAQWAGNGLRNGYAQYGASMNQAADWGGQKIAGVTSYAPAAMSIGGGVVTATGAAVATHAPVPYMPQNLVNLAKTTVVAGRLMPSFGEATARHGMADTVNPSLDAEIAKQEAAARKLLPPSHTHTQQAESKVEGGQQTRGAVGINHPDNPDFHLFKGAQTGVHGIDASFNHTPDLHSDQLAGALAAKAKQEGLQSIERVVLSEDRARAFAVDTPDLAAVNRHLAYVDVVAGRQQPLSVSTEQAAEVDRQQDRAANAPQLTASVTAEQQAQDQQSVARRMG